MHFDFQNIGRVGVNMRLHRHPCCGMVLQLRTVNGTASPVKPDLPAELASTGRGQDQVQIPVARNFDLPPSQVPDAQFLGMHRASSLDNGRHQAHNRAVQIPARQCRNLRAQVVATAMAALIESAGMGSAHPPCCGTSDEECRVGTCKATRELCPNLATERKH